MQVPGRLGQLGVPVPTFVLTTAEKPSWGCKQGRSSTSLQPTAARAGARLIRTALLCCYYYCAAVASNDKLYGWVCFLMLKGSAVGDLLWYCC